MSRNPDFMLTVDVEDWFHLVGAGLDYQFVSESDAHASWNTFLPRLDVIIPWILDQLDHYNRKATFFILGWAARHHPEIVKEIDRRGHEIASHGFWHRIVYNQTRDQFRDDLISSKRILEDISGKAVLGYRASSASITDWALDILIEEGFRYDASYFPVTYHDVYGSLTGLHEGYPVEKHSSGIIEMKFSCLNIRGVRLPWSGGGYFRLMPMWLFDAGIRHILGSGTPFIFFVHPWELDTGAPRLKALKRRYAWRRYVGVSSARSRFLRLLEKYESVRIDSYLYGRGLI